MNMTPRSLSDLAEAVREAYTVNEMHPTDMVEELARAHDLNPEQVKRLCEASNMAIKNYMKKGKVDDIAFPLASSHEVLARLQPGEEEDPLETNVTASLAPESRIREFARFYLSGKGKPMVKTAAYRGDPVKSCAAVLSELTKRANAKRLELSKIKGDTAKVASRIIDYLSDEARTKRSLNQSYTAVKECLPDNEAVEPMYKTAHKMICEGLHYPYPEPELVKLAGRIPNPGSNIVVMFEKYASLLTEMISSEAALREVEAHRDAATADLRDMIVKVSR